MAIPKFFNETGTAGVATYDYYDLAEGTGIIEFMGFGTIVSGAFLYGLTTNDAMGSCNADPAGTLDTQNHGGYTKLTTGDEFNFDIDFANPKQVQGTGYVCIPLDEAGGVNRTYSYTINVFHYDGTTETCLGSTTTPTLTIQANESKMDNIKVSLSGQHFKSGETLRLNIIAVVSNDTTERLGHSPSNQDTNFTYGNRLSFFCPFRIEV